jgi:hypothetical protein
VVAQHFGMQLKLTDEEAAALLGLLNRTIDNYPLSPRIRGAGAIRTKLPGAPSDPRPSDRREPNSTFGAPRRRGAETAKDRRLACVRYVRGWLPNYYSNF